MPPVRSCGGRDQKLRMMPELALAGSREPARAEWHARDARRAMRAVRAVCAHLVRHGTGLAGGLAGDLGRRRGRDRHIRRIGGGIIIFG